MTEIVKVLVVLLRGFIQVVISIFFFFFLTELHDVDKDVIPLQLDSHAFVLCDRRNKDTALSQAEETPSSSADVQRNDSTTSRASSKVSFSGVRNKI